MACDAHMTSLVFIACVVTHGMMWHDFHCMQINYAPQFMHMMHSDMA